jgi:hypothetical protein
VSWRDVPAQVLADLRNGRHREAYTIFVIGLILTLLGLLGVVSEAVLLSGILIAVTFLVFQTTVQLDDVAGFSDESLKGATRWKCSARSCRRRRAMGLRAYRGQCAGQRV